MKGTWKTGKKRPQKPLSVQFAGEIYTGWVSDIFKSIIRRAEAEGRRLGQGWEDQVWNALAVKYPNYINFVPDPEETVTVSVATIINFVQFLKRRGLNKSFVSTQEAEERAATCARCPKAAPMVGCTACKATVKTLIKPPEHKLDFGTRYNMPNQGCSACGCYLPAKVWIPMRFLEEERGKFDWWEECWMLQNGSSSEISN